MDAQLAARRPLEVLHDIGEEHRLARYASVVKAAVEELAGRADEGMAFLVFAVSGLFADHHDADFGMGTARRVPVARFAEDGLGCVAIEVASAAVLYGFSEADQIVVRGEKGCRAGSCF